MAALLIKMSMPPKAAIAAEAMAVADSKLVTSTDTPSAWCPSALSASATAVAADSFRSAMKLDAPAWHRARA